MPRVGGLLEAVLYVGDLDRSVEFYRRIFGFEVLETGRAICALGVVDRQVLLLCRKGGAVRPRRISGGIVPAHDGEGEMHLAFAVSASDLEAWQEWLERHGVAVESRVEWDRGGRSLYFRDPDRHLLELATPGTWAIY